MGLSAFLKFIFLLACLLACSSVVSAQETYTDEELDAMSDEELELLCIVRGFELVKDHVIEETGEVYTLQHADYVTAAKQCLSIEREMNEILEEHPELREELEEEIIKMQQEQAERREELEKLQQQLKDSEADASDASTPESAAFVGKPKLDQVEEETADEPATPETAEEQTVESETLEEEIEGEKDNKDSAEEEVETTDESTEESSAHSTTDKTEGLEISDEERVPLNEEEEAALEEQKKLPDEELTLEYLRVEFIKYVKKDIERLTRILVPILKPMLNAGELAIRYIRAALSTLREAYANQQQANASA